MNLHLDRFSVALEANPSAHDDASPLSVSVALGVTKEALVQPEVHTDQPTKPSLVSHPQRSLQHAVQHPLSPSSPSTQTGDRLVAQPFFAAQGIIVALLAPSGGGKTTLLSAMVGLVPSSGGRLVVLGEDHTMTPLGSRPIGIVQQQHDLFGHLSVYDNIRIAWAPRLPRAWQTRLWQRCQRLRLHGSSCPTPARNLADQRDTSSVPWATDETAKVRHLLEQVDLPSSVMHRRADALSGGEQRRISLARLLATRHPVVLLDEPFSALHPTLRARLSHSTAQWIKTTNRIAIVATHDADFVRQHADYVILLGNGKVVDQGTSDAMQQSDAWHRWENTTSATRTL
ncbi:MAG: ATP-binding cassette domain-containing protein [Alphaproteobacteria bacterium]|nr:ATP-binding cassette domain-containing protein [Alphaproteobacteria bacterium]